MAVYNPVSMERDTRPFHIWLLLVALNALQTAYYWPRLPEVVAQHFGAEGRPNGWASKESFVTFMWTLMLAVSGLFLVLSRLLRRLPFRWLNIPYRDYWGKTPARQEQARALVTEPLEWIGAAVTALLTIVVHLTFRANLRGGQLENPLFLAAFFGFLGFMGGWMFSFIRRFRPPAP